MLQTLTRILLFGFFTVLTQIGGVAYFIALLVGRSNKRKLKTFGLFLGFYVALSVMAVFVAPKFGRVPLPCLIGDETVLAMKSPILCVLNRQYVKPSLKNVAMKLANRVNEQFAGTVTLALDANFPFFDGFPLLPHLSHNDGRKLDIAYFYTTRDGTYIRGRTKSPIGYWAFEAPNSASKLPCAKRFDILTARWNVSWFEPFLKNYHLEEKRLRATLHWLVENGSAEGVEKIFIEPHLAERLNVSGKIIRFQGCRAARHDDHLHIQVK